MGFVLFSEQRAITFAHGTKAFFFNPVELCFLCGTTCNSDIIQVSPSHQDPAMVQTVNRRPVTANFVIRL
jgi:hypothetical protein